MPHVGENTSVFTGHLARLQCPILKTVLQHGQKYKYSAIKKSILAEHILQLLAVSPA